jgi:hypothetical protein
MGPSRLTIYLSQILTAAQGQERRQWPWPPNVGFYRASGLTAAVLRTAAEGQEQTSESPSLTTNSAASRCRRRSERRRRIHRRTSPSRSRSACRPEATAHAAIPTPAGKFCLCTIGESANFRPWPAQSLLCAPAEVSHGERIFGRAHRLIPVAPTTASLMALAAIRIDFLPVAPARPSAKARRGARVKRRNVLGTETPGQLLIRRIGKGGVRAWRHERTSRR